jgi:hypothetical protein
MPAGTFFEGAGLEKDHLQSDDLSFKKANGN